MNQLSNIRQCRRTGQGPLMLPRGGDFASCASYIVSAYALIIVCQPQDVKGFPKIPRASLCDEGLGRSGVGRGWRCRSVTVAAPAHVPTRGSRRLDTLQAAEWSAERSAEQRQSDGSEWRHSGARGVERARGGGIPRRSERYGRYHHHTVRTSPLLVKDTGGAILREGRF